MLSTVLKSSIVHKVCNYSSKVVFFRSQPSSTTPALVTLRETPFSDVIKDDGVLSEMLKSFNLKSSSPGINLLKELKTAKMFKLGGAESALEAFNVSSPLLPLNTTPQTVYVRSFYDRLFKEMWRSHRAVLIGNPGVSKSWFQWYMMYRLVNHVDVGANEDGYNRSTKLIVRQTGIKTVDFYFPSQEKTSVYLFEPSTSLIEPEFDLNFAIRIFSTCSPNQVRYKEFCKNGAIKYYMPCWTLQELNSFGSYIANHELKDKDFMHPQAIEEHYKRFGGIIRYVIPKSKLFLEDVMAAQDSVLKTTKAVDAFMPYANIEKHDDQKENITQFILCYDVEYDHEYKNGVEFREFKRFRMKIASEYVKNNLDIDMTHQDLLVSIKNLQDMLVFGSTKVPLLFEAVVYNTVINGIYQWQVFANGKWVEHNWELTKKQKVKDDTRVENLKPGVLYRAMLQNFPAVDMFFVKEGEKKKKEVFGIQVTFANKHPIEKVAYEWFYEHLGLDPETDAVTIYIISSTSNAESYAEGYAKGLMSYFYKGSNKIKPLPKLRFVAVKTSTNFNVPISTVNQ